MSVKFIYYPFKLLFETDQIGYIETTSDCIDWEKNRDNTQLRIAHLLISCKNFNALEKCLDYGCSTFDICNNLDIFAVYKEFGFTQDTAEAMIMHGGIR